MLAERDQRVSVDEYLVFERQSETRHELVDGQVVAMTGASLAHNQIVSNLVAALHPLLKTRGCGVWSSDLRVRVPATELITYPDLVVVCGEPELEGDDLDVLLNPTLIVEVLSPSTEAYDRGRKFDHYRTIDSLRDYVLITQDRVHIDHLTRQDDGRWLLAALDRDSAELALDAVGCSVALSDVYDRVPGLGTE